VFTPAWAHGRFGVLATLGAEVHPRVPRLGYVDAREPGGAQGRGFVRQPRSWHVQPLLALELLVRWR
jgi:hypothetical protein